MDYQKLGMEKEAFFVNPQAPPASSWHPSPAPAPEMMNRVPPDHQLPLFVNLNWGNQSQSVDLKSALGSLVSSPSSSSAAAPPPAFVIRELIGRLGGICNNSGEISPPPPSSQFNLNGDGATDSCYNSPLRTTLPQLDLSMLDLRRNSIPAARLSCFGEGPGHLAPPEEGKLSRTPSSRSLNVGPVHDGGAPMAIEAAARFKSVAREDLSAAAADPMAGAAMEGGGGGGSRKRKAAVTKCKGKETPSNSDNTKQLESGDEKRCKPGKTNGSSEKEKEGKQVEPPKDYIHVRARRGQATDSHSLAERVRREKISQRMKFLQDLVPGCNKVTGKAVMLDEIINYVQSLQCQVEFLSMKLATVNPRLDMDLDIDNFIPKDIHHHARGTLPHYVYPMEAASTGYSFAFQPHQGASLVGTMASNGLDAQCPANPLDASLRRALTDDGYIDTPEDDLNSVVQMGFWQNQEGAFSSESFKGSLPVSHMKIEL